MSEKKSSSKKLILIGSIVIGFLITAAGFFYLGNLAATNGKIVTSTNVKVDKDLAQVGDTDKYKDLFEVRKTIFQYYDGEIDDEVLLEGAIKGMTDSLKDPYTVFMNKSEFDRYIEQNSGSFIGIGVQIGIQDDKVTVIAPIEGSPAEKAGILSGDVIISVEDTVIGKDIDKAVSLITGKEKKPVNLVLWREGKGEFNLQVDRDEIKTIDVTSEMLDSEVGYLQLKQFDENVSKDFKKHLEDLKNKGMKGLILDLRGNPGGYLDQAVAIASQFIPKGEVVTYTVDKYDKKVDSLSAGGVGIDTPLVVLIDKGSASASEVVTGALRDHKKATIVGVTSFGKGIVQQMIKFPDGKGGLKVTMAKYYTPNGENIHKIGIKPDIEVEYPKELLEKPYDKKTDPQLQKALEVIKSKI